MNDISAVMPDVKLRLHIAYPSHEETYSFGYECAKAGMTEEENPYTKDSQLFEDWLEGWWAGFYEEEPLFELTTPLQTPELAPSDSAAPSDSSANKEAHSEYANIITNVLTIAGAITVTAVIGYQILDLVA